MSYLILAFSIIVFAFLIYSIAGIYHLWRFGYSGDLSKLAIVVYSLICGGIIFAAYFLLVINYLEA